MLIVWSQARSDDWHSSPPRPAADHSRCVPVRVPKQPVQASDLQHGVFTFRMPVPCLSPVVHAGAAASMLCCTAPCVVAITAAKQKPVLCTRCSCCNCSNRRWCCGDDPARQHVDLDEGSFGQLADVVGVWGMYRDGHCTSICVQHGINGAARLVNGSIWTRANIAYERMHLHPSTTGHPRSNTALCWLCHW